MLRFPRAIALAVTGIVATVLGITTAGQALVATTSLTPTVRLQAAPQLGDTPTKHPESEAEINAANANALRSSSVDVDVVGARLSAIKQAAALPTGTGQYGNAWTDYGPQVYRSDDRTYGDVGGLTKAQGRATALVIDPSDKTGNTVWAGFASGGVWLTKDGGKHWTPKFDDMPSLIIGAMAIDPADPKTIYVGTGDNATGGFYVFPGTGVYVSRDGGDTWSRPAKNLKQASTVYQIEIAGGRVFVASNMGLFRSIDKGASFENVRLPTNATHDGVYSSRLGNVVTDVRAKPGSPGQITAVVGWRKGKYGTPNSVGNGLYRSTQGGAPGTWSFMETNLGYASSSGDPVGRTALVYDPQQPEVMYASVQDAGKFGGDLLDLVQDSLLGVVNPYNGLYRSGDDGKTWTLKAGPQHFQAAPGSGLAAPFPGVQLYTPGVQSWYNLWVDVDPQNSDNVLVGLEEVYIADQNVNSDNGTGTFRTIGRYWNACALQLDQVDCSAASPVYEGETTIHPDQHSDAMMVVNGKTRLYVGNDGGVFVQDEDENGFDNASWRELNTGGISTLQPYNAVISGDGTVYAGLQDNGTAKIKPGGGEGWEVFGGDGGDVAVEPDNSDNAWEEYVFANVRVTEDGGRTWTTIAPAIDGTQFINPFEMDPLDKDHVVLPGQQILETDLGVKTRCELDDNSVDTNAEAQVFKFGFPCDWMLSYDMGINKFSGAGNQPSGLDVRGANIYVAYCGVCDVLTTGGGDASKFHNGIATNVGGDMAPAIGKSDGWHNIDEPKGLPHRYISDVAIDPTDVKTIYVTLSGWSRKWFTPDAKAPGVGKGQVYVSHDAGKSFTDFSANLPDVPANAALVRGDHVFVANDIGVYARPKVGGSWVRLGVGLPNAPASDINLNPKGDKLVVATYGRGVWVYNFGGTAPAPVKKPTKVLGKQQSKNLPATGADTTTALGIVLIACAALLARRERATR